MIQYNVDLGGNDLVWRNKPELPPANKENRNLEEMVNPFYIIHLNSVYSFMFILNQVLSSFSVKAKEDWNWTAEVGSW